METIPSPRLGFFRGVFLASHLASTDNLTRTTKRHTPTWTKNTMKNYTKTKTNRAWFSRLLQHLARNQSGSILTTRKPAQSVWTTNQWRRQWSYFLVQTITSVGTHFAHPGKDGQAELDWVGWLCKLYQSRCSFYCS